MDVCASKPYCQSMKVRIFNHYLYRRTIVQIALDLALVLLATALGISVLGAGITVSGPAVGMLLFSVAAGILLINATALFRTYCIEGIEANIEHCERWLEESRCLATALAPYIGHEKAGEISRQAKQDGKTIREVVLSRGMFTEEELNIIFSAQELTRPGIAGQRKLKQMKEKK